MSNVVSSKIFKIWHGEMIVQVLVTGDIVSLEEQHEILEAYDSYENVCSTDEFCVNVVISQKERVFTWTDRRGKLRKEKFKDTIRNGFLLAIDRFVKILGGHLKKELDEEKLSSWEWSALRRTLWDGLSPLVPEKEEQDHVLNVNKKLMLIALRMTKRSASINKFPDIESKIAELIKEVKEK